MPPKRKMPPVSSLALGPPEKKSKLSESHSANNSSPFLQSSVVSPLQFCKYYYLSIIYLYVNLLIDFTAHTNENNIIKIVTSVKNLPNLKQDQIEASFKPL